MSSPPPQDPPEADPPEANPPAGPASLSAYADQLIELALSQQQPQRLAKPRPADPETGDTPFEPQAFRRPDPPVHASPLSDGDSPMSESTSPALATTRSDPSVEPVAPTQPAVAPSRPADAPAALQAAVHELSSLGRILNLKILIGLGAVAALMLIALGVFASVGLKLSGRITQLDGSVFAVGKRVVELEAGLQNLAAISQQLGVVAKRQEELMRTQAELKTQVDSALRQSASIVSQVPQQAARELAATQEGLSKQVRSLDSRLQVQAGAVNALGRDVQNLQQSVASVPALRKDIETLVTLQRERYLEQLQKQSEVNRKPPPAPRPPALPQYPRPGPAEPSGAQTRD
jgi:hypothetical protein